MKYAVVFALLTLLGCAAILAQTRSGRVSKKEITVPATMSPEVSAAVGNGAKWLASVQGADGGWGQDGGATSNVRQTENLESQGNDVANTAVAALALLRAGDQYRPNVERAVNFILKKIEASPAEGFSITDVNQTQIQRKLGPYIDTFLASMLLARVDGADLDHVARPGLCRLDLHGIPPGVRSPLRWRRWGMRLAGTSASSPNGLRVPTTAPDGGTGVAGDDDDDGGGEEGAEALRLLEERVDVDHPSEQATGRCRRHRPEQAADRVP